MKTNLNLVNECDKYIAQNLSSMLRLITCSFPYYENDAEEYTTLRSTCWEFHLEGGSGPYGYIQQSVVERMPWDPSVWHFDNERRCITPVPKRYTRTQGDVIRETLEKAKTGDIFQILRLAERIVPHPWTI